MNKSEGYVLCVFGKQLYLDLALRAYKNIRTFDAVRPICILTDNIPFFQSKTLENVVLKEFDYRNHLFPDIDYNNIWNKYGLTPKLFQSYYTPFDVTMYLDVDMIFFQDFTIAFDLFYKANQPLLLPGLSDGNNRSPSDWHWGHINSVMGHSGLNIPQCFSTLMVYDKAFSKLVEKNIGHIFQNLKNWTVLSNYCDGYPDEIIYALLCGLERIFVNKEIFLKLHDSKFCDPVNKSII